MCSECKTGIIQAPVYKVNCTECKTEPHMSLSQSSSCTSFRCCASQLFWLSSYSEDFSWVQSDLSLFCKVFQDDLQIIRDTLNFDSCVETAQISPSWLKILLQSAPESTRAYLKPGIIQKVVFLRFINDNSAPRRCVRGEALSTPLLSVPQQLLMGTLLQRHPSSAEWLACFQHSGLKTPQLLATDFHIWYGFLLVA